MTGCINRDVHMALFSLSSTATLTLHKQDIIRKSGSGANVVLHWACHPKHLYLTVVKVTFYHVGTWFIFNVSKSVLESLRQYLE